MAKIKSLSELKALKEKLQSKVDIREKGENVENLIQVKISMATCGIAAGAKDIMNVIIESLNEKNINNAVVTQTGCMGLCHSEPTIEVTLPGQEGVVFGNVDKVKAEEIVNKYIKDGDLVDGIIPAGYKTLED